MSVDNEIHYNPGSKPSVSSPLDRFLPPIRSGVGSDWLSENIPPGGWILDPFGASPALAYEAALNGYNIIVTANNPINRFILEMVCSPPSAADFQAAIAMLASSQVGRERLEPHIRALYETVCEACGRSIQASAFIWRKDESTPFARIYDCPVCKDSGEHPVTAVDVQNAQRFQKGGLHLARALERVTPLHDPDRRHVEAALEVYPPRAIYALITIINKLSGIPKRDPNHRLLSALLLLAFDRANALWRYPKARERPKQLSVPTHFLEHNIWLALETAVDLWVQNPNPVPISKWPESPPPGGGVCLYEGRIKELAANLPQIDVSAVLTCFPRPNQAFWTLSALWSGWLWGPEALEHFKSVLRRRRYDWNWHTNAIQGALACLEADLPEGTPYYGLINEVEPGFLSAVLLGSRLSNLKFCGAALRTGDSQAQILWRHSRGHQNELEQEDETRELIQKSLSQATHQYLRNERGEPSPYIYLHASALIGLVSKPRSLANTIPSDYLSQVGAGLQQAFSYRNGFLRYDGSDKSLEVGQFWVRESDPGILPLADRVEMALVKILLNNPRSTYETIDSAICRELPGLCPPENALVQVCLESYGSRDDGDPRFWSIREGDTPGRRRKDIHEITALLHDLGKRLNFESLETQGEIAKIDWVNDAGHSVCSFIVAASAIIGKYLRYPNLTDGKLKIVIPGGRSNLVAYKLRQNPHLSQIAKRQWQFIKYRHIRQITESANFNADNFEDQFAFDPITYTQPQMRMF